MKTSSQKRKAKGVPASVNGKTQSSRTNRIAYLHQKVLGKRSHQGQSVMGHLGPRHKEIIALHLEGKTGPEIAEEIGCTQMTVHRTLSSELAKPYIDAFHAAIDKDIAALAPKAVAALSHVVEKGEGSERTAAAREIFKLNNRYPKEDATPPGTSAAELLRDVVSLARESISDVRRVERRPAAQIIDAESRVIEEGDK